MPISSKVRAIRNALRVQGLAGFVRVLLDKKDKRQRYSKMLKELPLTSSVAVLREHELTKIEILEKEKIIVAADALLRDENLYFTFPYNLRGVERPWNHDPFEHNYWPSRHYTEQKLHAEDTPQDVKIVWEVNRFKDLPTLAQAAYLTHDKRYADEIEWRLLSWIEDNPFAESINWASGLEIAIRIISWTASIELLRAAGFDLSKNERIARSIYEQVVYLRADLSTDKIVRSNHLIGEVAGLFYVSSVWEFPGREEYAATARAILEEEIVRQTYPDGATRESTTWYHGFVTDFFDIVARVGKQAGKPFSNAFTERLSRMKSFREQTIQPDGTPVRIGDADDGYALYFEGEKQPWFDALFGEVADRSVKDVQFDVSKYIFHSQGGFALYVRGGEFGMGGSGSSSHAHDDQLAPVVWLKGLPVLVDAGTFVYNGAAKYRSRYRSDHSHNTFSLDEGSKAKQRLNFGWYEVRDLASIVRLHPDPLEIQGSYAEWPGHKRTIRLTDSIEITDEVAGEHTRAAARLHLHPIWKQAGEYEFVSEEGRRLRLEVMGWEKVTPETYDFSPSYRVQVPATKIILRSEPVSGKLRVVLRVD